MGYRTLLPEDVNEREEQLECVKISQDLANEVNSVLNIHWLLLFPVLRD